MPCQSACLPPVHRPTTRIMHTVYSNFTQNKFDVTRSSWKRRYKSSRSSRMQFSHAVLAVLTPCHAMTIERASRLSSSPSLGIFIYFFVKNKSRVPQSNEPRVNLLFSLSRVVVVVVVAVNNHSTHTLKINQSINQSWANHNIKLMMWKR
jgi:hypothetical protein